MGHLSLQQALRKVRKTERGYTLLELLAVLGIILLLSTLGFFLYSRCIAYAKETVCKTNLRALEEAIELYVTDNDALPVSLGHLKLEHLEKAYAKAMEDRTWFKKVCVFLVKMHTSDHAYAQFLTYENLKKYGATEEIFHCPADPDGGVSYGINGNLAGKSWSDVGGDLIIVGDCDSHVFTSPDQLRGRHDNKAFGTKRGGKIVEIDGGEVKKEKEANDFKYSGDHHEEEDDD